MNIHCNKCNGAGWVRYDEWHLTVCDECCTHSNGWWLLENHYGEDNGKLCCLSGCGKTREHDGNF